MALCFVCVYLLYCILFLEHVSILYLLWCVLLIMLYDIWLYHVLLNISYSSLFYDIIFDFILVYHICCLILLCYFAILYDIIWTLICWCLLYRKHRICYIVLYFSIFYFLYVYVGYIVYIIYICTVYIFKKQSKTYLSKCTSMGLFWPIYQWEALPARFDQRKGRWPPGNDMKRGAKLRWSSLL